MSETSVQRRKMCFVEIEEGAEPFFEEAFAGHDTSFVERLDAVPEDTEVLSVFISERIDSPFLDAHPLIRLIATRSTGCDHIDLDACASRGVTVVNVGDYGENTVAEHSFALVLALSRRLRDSEQAVRTGRFSRERLRGFDLRGKTLGVIGAGRVGLHVIRIGIGFGMRVIAYDEQPHPFYSELLDFHYVPFEQLMRESHVVTLHVPLNSVTRHMINRETLALCRLGVLLINTARGGLIDSGALIEALDSGQVAGVGLDVLEDERVFRRGRDANSERKNCRTGAQRGCAGGKGDVTAAGFRVFEACCAQSALTQAGGGSYSACRLQQPRSDRTSQHIDSREYQELP